MIKLRNAISSDANNLAMFAENTFRDAFADQNTVEDMDLHCRSTYGEAIQLQEISDPEYRTIIAEEGNKIVAYTQLRWKTKPDCVSSERAGEILRMYVESSMHGTGLAQSMMSAALSALKEHGSDVAWLGVWEKNPKAIAFYKKFNFREVGSHVYVVGSDPQRDIILTREV